MSALKIFALAGGLVIGAATVASSADLPPPPMPAYPPAPLRGSIDASGVYLRGDVGMGYMGETKARFQNLPAATVVTYNQGDFGNVGFAGVGIGYQFNSWFRADLTAELRGSARINFSDTYVDATGSGRNVFSGNLRSSVFLANAYVDLGNWHGLTPFLGAGAGVAWHRVSRLDDVGVRFGGGCNVDPAVACPVVGGFEGKSKMNFAWALMAGLAYDVTPNVKVELGYRYLNMGRAESDVACAGGPCPAGVSVGFRDLQSHDIKLGVRWLLSGPEYAPAPMPIVVRKG